MNVLKNHIESLLFVASKPLETKLVAKLVGAEEENTRQILTELQEERKESGVVILEANDTWQMATSSDSSELVMQFLNSDLRENLTEATVEVLAIIAYRAPISKAEIEAIRGVNSQYSVRHLLMRGLIEKIPNPRDSRGALYQITTEFLQHMGIQSVRDLPSFTELVSKIKLPETPEQQDAAVVEAVAEEEQKNLPE